MVSFALRFLITFTLFARTTQIFAQTFDFKDDLSGSGICAKYGAPGEIPPGSFTSCGDFFDANAFTAAQLEGINPRFPCNTTLQVTNPANGKSVTVRLNDHGGGVSSRVLDLTFPAFNEISGDPNLGLINCSYKVIDLGEEDR